MSSLTLVDDVDGFNTIGQTFSYDPATGRLSGITDAGSGIGVSYPFTAADPMTERSQTSLGGTWRTEQVRAHDGLGRLSGVTTNRNNDGFPEVSDGHTFGYDARAKAVYSAQDFGTLRQRLPHWREIGADAEVEALRAKVCGRMNDLGAFMKGFKQRFGGWFNRRSGRRGTLWEERYKSVLVEGDEALAVIAAYIDLNPVRAGVVGDPKDWRWSGYGAALGGVRKARSGLREIMRLQRGGGIGEKDALEAYRAFVFESAEERAPGGNGARGRRGAKPAVVARAKAAQGELGPAELVRSRVRHFADSAALGTEKLDLKSKMAL